jgi:hypothetical protein
MRCSALHREYIDARSCGAVQELDSNVCKWQANVSAGFACRWIVEVYQKSPSVVAPQILDCRAIP